MTQVKNDAPLSPARTPIHVAWRCPNCRTNNDPTLCCCTICSTVNSTSCDQTHETSSDRQVTQNPTHDTVTKHCALQEAASDMTRDVEKVWKCPNCRDFNLDTDWLCANCKYDASSHIKS